MKDRNKSNSEIPKGSGRRNSYKENIAW